MSRLVCGQVNFGIHLCTLWVSKSLTNGLDLYHNRKGKTKTQIKGCDQFCINVNVTKDRVYHKCKCSCSRWLTVPLFKRFNRIVALKFIICQYLLCIPQENVEITRHWKPWVETGFCFCVFLGPMSYKFSNGNLHWSLQTHVSAGDIQLISCSFTKLRWKLL